MLTKAVFIWSKYSKNSTIMKCYYNLNLLFSTLIYFKMSSLIQNVWSFRNHSNMLICKVENSCAFQDYEYEAFISKRHIINAFTDTGFDQ